MNYATLYEFRRYRGLATAETSDDALIEQLLRHVSRYIDSIRRCDPRVETRLYDYPGESVSRFGVYAQSDFAYSSMQELRLDDDLLALTTLTNGDSETVTSDQYYLRPNNRYPKNGVKLKSTSGVNWETDSSGNVEQCISVLGIWGYHPDYASRAWVSSGDSVQNAGGISAAATSITVTDADGVDSEGAAMRFQSGQLLKIDSEFLLLTAQPSTSTNILIVTRGYNGSTAAAHDKDTIIYVYHPYENVKRATLRLTTWLYTQKDVSQFDRMTLLGEGVILTPTQIPDDVLPILPPHRPMNIR